MIDLTTVAHREELEIIPQGLSLTETSIACYLRLRIDNDIICIRIIKDPEVIDTIRREVLVEGPDNWYGVRGTKG